MPCTGSQHQARSAGRQRLAVVTLRTRRSIRCAAELDVSIGVKIGLAESSGQLDLSEKSLESIPESVFELVGLEVRCLVSPRSAQAVGSNLLAGAAGKKFQDVAFALRSSSGVAVA